MLAGNGNKTIYITAISSDSGQFIQIFLIKVPNKSAILEHSKNMHIGGVYLQFKQFEATQLSHPFLAKNGIKSDSFS